ncbi:MAG: large subunit ribosomal protein [Patescibacteria group bacterium]|nr:large subunit ribosomal protein [Patescibacteria group bacterium]
MLTLNAEKREVFGKTLKFARKDGKLPVVIYGRKQEAENYFIDTKEFNKVYKEAGESTVIEFKTAAGDHDVLVKDADHDPISGEVIHVDFYVVEKGKKVEVEVPLVFEGESPAVKNLNGVLVKVIHDLPIEAMPKDLPHDITVDISGLVDFDSQITVADLKLPAGVTVMIEENEVVALVSEPKDEPVESEPVDISAIEVEQKGKKDEEGGEPASE